MSFSLSVKNELLENENLGCCAGALLSAIIHTGGSINISRRGLFAEITTENEKLAETFAALLKCVFGAEAEISGNKKSSLKKHILFTVQTPPKISEEILKELGIIKLDQNNHRQIVSGIDKYITEQKCCKISYIKGALLSCGSITADAGKNSGYSCSFVLSNAQIAEDLKTILDDFGIRCKIAERINNYIVYIKESESICDLLALLGASKSFLDLQNIIINREMKNNTNRQTNCIVANIDKTVNAAIKQIEAINKIENAAGLGFLPPHLRFVAEMRKAHPEASMEAIASQCGLTKSGVNHRIRKIIEISDSL